MRFLKAVVSDKVDLIIIRVMLLRRVEIYYKTTHRKYFSFRDKINLFDLKIALSLSKKKRQNNTDRDKSEIFGSLHLARALQKKIEECANRKQLCNCFSGAKRGHCTRLFLNVFVLENSAQKSCGFSELHLLYGNN